MKKLLGLIALVSGCAYDPANGQEVLTGFTSSLSGILKILLGALTCIVLFAGCAYNEPKFSMKLNPATGEVSVLDTKDTAVTVDEVTKIGADNSSLTVKNLKVDNKASSVIIQNVEQMKIAVAQIQQVANGMIGVSKEVGETISPWKAVADKVQELNIAIDAASKTVKTGSAATTQPVK